jgi:hypothetical protein
VLRHWGWKTKRGKAGGIIEEEDEGQRCRKKKKYIGK